jgi:hypothetical protein
MSESKLSSNDPGSTYFSNAEVYIGDGTATLRKLSGRINMLISKGKKENKNSNLDILWPIFLL